MLYKIDFDHPDKPILRSEDLLNFDIQDPRGIAIVGDKLYIGDGDDWRTDDLLHAIHIFDLP